MRYRKAETHEQPVSDVADNGSVKSSNSVGARIAVFVDDVSEFFLVEPHRQIGRPDHINEKNRNLAPLRALILARRAGGVGCTGEIRALGR